jgi:TonB family protein
VKAILRAALFILPGLCMTGVQSSSAQDSVPLDLSKVPICRDKKDKTPDCVVRPRPITTPDPNYPASERKARHTGTVRLELVVGSDGLPRDITVSRSLSPEFDAAAIDAVKRWKFSPAIQGNRSVAVLIPVEVSFRIFR